MGKFEKLCNEYRENKRLMEELGADCDRLKEEILTLMGGQEVYSEGASKVIYKLIASTRFDSAAFKKEHEELYKKYSKTSESYRFVVA